MLQENQKYVIIHLIYYQNCNWYDFIPCTVIFRYISSNNNNNHSDLVCKIGIYYNMRCFMDKYTKLIDLGKFAGIRDTIPQEELINYKKLFNKTYSASQQESKRTHCYYCNKPCNSFCNSHTIPAFCLKYISKNGKLYHMNTMVDIPFLKKDKGVKEAGVFHIICRDCDSKIFQDYENENNYDKIPTTKMLAQIAMKNSLKLISKREFENALYNEMSRNLGCPSAITDFKHIVNAMDLKEYISAYNKAKKSSLKPFDGDYHIYTHIELPYRVPIAFQGSVALICDLEGKVVNDIYNYNANYEIKNVHLCVFPFNSKSIIMLFVENGNKRYSSFFKQFKKLPLEEQLKVVNYIIFAYTEDFFMSPVLSDNTISELTKTACKSTELVSSNPLLNGVETAVEHFSFDEMNTIPNILSEEYKINEESKGTTI